MNTKPSASSSVGSQRLAAIITLTIVITLAIIEMAVALHLEFILKTVKNLVSPAMWVMTGLWFTMTILS